MALKLLSFTILALALVNAIPALGVTEFIADEAIYEEDTRHVRLIGNAEIRTEQGYFYVEELRFNTVTEAISVRGRVRALLASGEKILADFAELAPNSQQVILGEVKLWLANNMQIAAKHARHEPDETYGERVIATTCKICRLNPTPIWQIRADQVLREGTEKIYFRNAWIDIGGVPIAYLPRFRIAGAEAKRVEGFLAPQLIFSNLYFSGIRIPYYWVMGDHADLTAKLYSTMKGVLAAEFDHRQETAFGRIDTDASIALDDGDGKSGRYYITNRLNFDKLPYDFKLDSALSLQSDYDYIPQFSYTNPSTDYLRLSRHTNLSTYESRFARYRPTSEAGVDSASPIVRPSAYYQTYRQIGRDTQLTIESNYHSLDRVGGDDLTRFGIGARVQNKSIIPFGLALESAAGVRANIYDIKRDTGDLREFAQRSTPYVAFDLTLPLVLESEAAQHLLVPRAQLVWSENYDNGVDVPNTDSLFVEHDYISLFTENRFVGEDRHERGFRLNAGTSYSVQENDGANLAFGLGGVYRGTGADALEGFEDRAGSGEWVAFADYLHPTGWTGYLRASANNLLNFSRSELGAEYTSDESDLRFDWVALAPEPEIGYDDLRHEISVSGRHRLSPNWEAKWAARQDLVAGEPIDASLGLTYGNECVEFDAGLTFDYAQEPGIEDEIRFVFDIDLLGVTKETNQKWGRSQCYR